MSTFARVTIAFALFLAVAGTVYGLTSHELTGTSFLLVASVVFAYLALTSRSSARREPETGQAEPPHVRSTIWPFGFSLAAVAIALGAVASRILLIVGLVIFAVSAAGWFRDIAHQHGAGEKH